MRTEVQNQNPELASAIENPERFRAIFRELQRHQNEAERARELEIARLNDNPFDLEAQAKIAEIIRNERVMENLQYAMEHNSEVFGRVNMLYIDSEINGHKVKAFVDSGAQATIMSPSCAEACGIMRLIDKRYSGIAKGVGTAKILGRVHAAQIKIGSLYLAASFTVMEGKDVDLLLGLDMLKRHQALIDLRRDKLVIGDVEVPFLGESEIPKLEAEEPTVEGPGGTSVGGRTGAIHQPSETTSAAQSVAGGTMPATHPAMASSSTGAPHVQPAAVDRAPPGRPQQPSGSTNASPEAVNQLVGMGFSREEAVAALQATGGNVDYAAGLLFGD
ncbi:MAG: DNA damage-inducible protein 1 [Vezdaea acicularis]|nr:MAG: DNA damage-inducible protein 1 [Vezdaea acicularis]